ncbi:MAG TPA: EamA family transporter [Ktedonobacterales bacterium]|jgi:drug/metabolite transporter (DMT)-like permease
MGKRDFGILLLLGAMWGASYLFIRITASALGPVVLMDARVLLAGGALMLYALAARRVPSFKGQWRAFLILGTINGAIPLTLIAAAELNLPASLAAMLNATVPLFTALVAAGWLKDRLTLKKVIGLLMGMVGVGVLVGLSPLPLTGIILLSAGASLLAALCYAFGNVYASQNFKGASPLALSIGQQLATGVVLVPFALLRLPTTFPSTEVLLAFLGLSLMSTAIAYLLYFHLIQTVGATKTAIVTFLVPVFGLLWGALFLQETATVGTVVGLAIVLSSVFLISGISLRSQKEPEEIAPALSEVTAGLSEVGD